jgi:hypothetical protein
MRLCAATLAICAAAFIGAAATARADTHAPSAQHVTMTCGSRSYDVVSPADAAHGGQVTSSTVEITALDTTVTDATTGQIVYQTTTASRNPQGQNCSFTIGGVIVSIYAIVTPLGH